MICTIVGMWGGFPKKNEPTSGYLVEKDGFAILLDAGSGVAAHVQNYIELNKLHHLFISHYHYDHSVDLGAFMFGRMIGTYIGGTKKHLNIYGPADEDVAGQVEDTEFNTFHPYDDTSEIKVGPFTMRFHKNTHPVETYAMKIMDDEGQILVYTADTSYEESLVRFAQNADVLITECSHYEGEDAESLGHMNAEEAALLAEKSGVKKVVLSHLPHYGDLDELLQTVKSTGIEEAVLAETGMEIEV